MKREMVFVMGLLVLAAGCVSYVDPEKPNLGKKEDYTRAETIPTGQRLVDSLLADAMFAQHYAAKVRQRGGTPVVQVAYIVNKSTHRKGRVLDVLRGDIETALRNSGWFLLASDPEACDYILCGEYADIPDGRRVTHRLSMRLHDIAADSDVWTGSDEIAKE